MAKCPYCFRTINPNTWLKDPIFLPNGAKYQWQDDTTLIEIPDIEDRIFKGFCQICEPEMQEIQDFLKQFEIDNIIIPLTTWSPLSLDGKFQITGKHIKEMRDSVEKILTNAGLTKTDYFNYDEEGNHIIHPLGDKIEWTDPITEVVDLKKFQVKAIHIEDLRHYIEVIYRLSYSFSASTPEWCNFIFHNPKLFIFSGVQVPVNYFSASGAVDVQNYQGSHCSLQMFGTSDTNSIDLINYVTLYDAGALNQGGRRFTDHIGLVEEIFHGWGNGHLIVANTHCKFTSILNVTTTGRPPINKVEIGVNTTSGNLIYNYQEGRTTGFGWDSTDGVFYLTEIQMETFDRNLYTDYITAFGIIPSNVYVGYDYDFSFYGKIVAPKDPPLSPPYGLINATLTLNVKISNIIIVDE